MRVIFFGSPAFAIPALDALVAAEHDIAAVVTQPDRPKGRGQRLVPTAVSVHASELGLTVWHPPSVRTPAFLDQVRELAPTLGVVVAYGRILPEALLEIPPRGMINLHASVLPRYRGAAPIHRAVLAGDTETGVTIMEVVPALDAGPMLAVERCAIGPDETSESLELRLAEIGARLLVRVMAALERGEVERTPQDDREATLAPRLTKSESPIDWSLTAEAIHNRVRGLTPWPLASTTLRGERLMLHRTAVHPPNPASDVERPPGEVVDAGPSAIVVACGQRSRLAVLDVQPEGRRRMHVRDYLSGHRLEPGERFDTG